MEKLLKSMGARGLFNLADSMANLAKTAGTGSGVHPDASGSKDDANNRFQGRLCSTDPVFQIMRDMRNELEKIEHLLMNFSQTRIEVATRLERVERPLPTEMESLTRFVTEVFHRG